MEISWIRENLVDFWSSPACKKAISQSTESLKDWSEVSLRNSGLRQKAAKMCPTHTLSLIRHVLIAVIYFFHSHILTICNPQHDIKKKAKIKSRVLLSSQLQRVERTVLTGPDAGGEVLHNERSLPPKDER